MPYAEEPNDWSLARRMVGRRGPLRHDRRVWSAIKHEDRLDADETRGIPVDGSTDPLRRPRRRPGRPRRRARGGGRPGCSPRAGTCSARSWSASRPSSPTTAASAHCVGVGSGLSALELSLRAAGIGPGDEVIVPAYTWIATWLAISAVGATPVGVRSSPTTYNLDPAAAAAAVSERTAAIMPVHLRGEVADMEPLRGARHDPRPVRCSRTPPRPTARGATAGRAGSIGDAAGFSFYPAKNLGAVGDGGAVTTDDAELAARVRLLRNYGTRNRYEIELRGRTRGWPRSRRRCCGRSCRTSIAGTPPGRSSPGATTPPSRGSRRSPCRGWPSARSRSGTSTSSASPSATRPRRARRGGDRDAGPLSDAAAPLSRLRRPGLSRGSFPISERLADEVLSLPMHPFVGAGAERVIAGLRGGRRLSGAQPSAARNSS